MDEHMIKLECLKLAVMLSPTTHDDVIIAAKKMYEFIFLVLKPD